MQAGMLYSKSKSFKSFYILNIVQFVKHPVDLCGNCLSHEQREIRCSSFME